MLTNKYNNHGEFLAMKEELKNNTASIACIRERVDNLKNEVGEVKCDVKSLIGKFDEFPKALNEQYVSRNEFVPIRSIVYGAVSLILVSVLSALIYLVLK